MCQGVLRVSMFQPCQHAIAVCKVASSSVVVLTSMFQVVRRGEVKAILYINASGVG